MDLRLFTEPQEGASYDDLLSVARAAEDAGYDAFFRSDHYLAMGDGDGRPGPTDAWTTLAGLARDTRTIRLGTLVTPATFRWPGVLAIQVAQVDQMSDGRVELGLGAGWYEAEHTAYGIDFPDVRERFDRLAEQLEIITGLWGTPAGQRFSFSGRHYRLTDTPALPRPVQLPHPPVIVGGAGRRRTPALAARFAQEFNAFADVARCRELFAGVRAACAEVGRDPATMQLSAAQVVCCGRTEAEFRARADVLGRDPDELRVAGVAGTVAECVQRLGALAEVGADRVYLQLNDLTDLDQIDLVAAEVMPQLR
ncbi:MAG: LLM class F420-dependent oxidoreductase [Geodermatophilaceae bacterium]|nr:LLM class F420-dependent oxidoreductase [Geodermatophilaceae bacterium]